MDINFDKPPKRRGPVPGTQDLRKPGTADPPDQAAHEKKDAFSGRWNISGWSEEIADIMSTVSLLPEVREAKVREIKANIYSGAYAVDPRKVAEAILKNSERF
jgi:flagellar biosynthesis anti-sigma factor FlgM